MNLYDMLRGSCEKFPDRPATIFKDVVTTYAQLLDKVDRLASSLAALGIRRGNKVGVMSRNCPEFIISYFATMKIGAVVVPVNFMLKADEALFILKDSESVCLIAQGDLYEVVNSVRLRLDSLQNLILIGKEKSHTGVDFYDLLKNTAHETDSIVLGDDDAAILYTSGTTGHPKGAVLRHRNIIADIGVCVPLISASYRDNLICVLPMFHSFAWTVCVALPLSIGARITVMEAIQPFKEVVRAITKWRVTVMVGVPGIYSVLAGMKLPGLLRISFIRRLLIPLRACISGAAALPVEVLNKFEAKYRIPLLEGYGLTEASPVVTITPLRGKHKPGSVGPALPNVKIRVVDENGSDVKSGEAGELIVQGPNVMRGYYKMADATKETLKEGWLYTGDMVRVDEDGYVFIVDRKKDMINVAGLKVYPREVEEILYQHEKVAEAAVVGIPYPHKGEVPKAVVALKEGQHVTEQELIKFCRSRIAPFKVPHKIEFRDSLPKTSTGKILRRVLR